MTRLYTLIALVILLSTPVLSAAEQMIFTESWGSFSVLQGTPSCLTLKNGSGYNLLRSGSDKSAAPLGIVYEESGVLYASYANSRADVKRTEEGFQVTGYFQDKHGSRSPDEGRYTINWRITDIGYLVVEFLASFNKVPAGTLHYDFPFNASWLNRYYLSAFMPNRARQNATLRKTPMDEIRGRGEYLHMTEDVISYYIGVLHSEMETINVVPERGIFTDLYLRNTSTGLIRYSNASINTRNIRAVFYILPAPVKKRRKLIRMNFATLQKVEYAGAERFIKMVDEAGFKYIDVHEGWQLHKSPDQRIGRDFPTMFGSHRPFNPEQERLLIDEAHKRDLKVLYYVGMVNEDNMTEFYQQQGNACRTEYDYAPRTRVIMCLQTPYLQHQFKDTDYICDVMGADGVYVDLFKVIACTKRHGAHPDLPATNIQQLIDYTVYVKNKGKDIIVHPAEETRLPFLEQLVDGVVLGERKWDFCGPEMTASGVFDRFTANTGVVGVIMDDAYIDLETNYALKEGQNPFGFLTYGASRWDKYSRTPHTYPLVAELLQLLRPYPVEEMEYIPASEKAAWTSSVWMPVSVIHDVDRTLLFVINIDPKGARLSERVRLDGNKLNIEPDNNYTVKNLSTGSHGESYIGSQMTGSGIPVTVPGMWTYIIEITKVSE